jgi:hypothetical protein
MGLFTRKGPVRDSYGRPVEGGGIVTEPTLFSYVTAGIVGFFMLMLIVLLVIAGFKTFGRYQARADANNQVTLNSIQIRQYEQKVHIAQQQANIRFTNSVGVRRAQDEIARTLTPLYVQFEMIDTLKAIAASGRNNSIIYIPTGANGVPLVSVSNQPQVYEGQSQPGKG